MQMIERNGTGVTGQQLIEKQGTGVSAIERSGTGMSMIERSGTGISMIERSGTGIRFAGFIALVVLLAGLLSSANAAEFKPGLVVQDGAVALSFQAGREMLIATGQQQDGYLVVPIYSHTMIVDGGSENTDTYGSGTGSQTDTYGSGTGSQTDTYGSGTGFQTDTYGSGTGSQTDTYGSGTGYETDTYGSGTGARTYGSGTGDRNINAVWGYAEIVLNGDTASVLIYQDNARGGLVERAALELPVFEM